ncbi:LOW QUALITY PROTEIN: hypothetical protein HID58_066817 [Brassica napus]|uniref:Uncharacterized protein n=1 Tax=Brassica napus TaxID=3708 RepID=A0ABQ7ZGS2_BRANA|nr:LOW QUALITY PROTEIN: hypothetical protein HID58_066817 [Brassica napus]
MIEDRLNRGHLAPGRVRPTSRSPRPWARTTRAEVTSPMGEDDPRRGHLAHGRGRPAPRSPRPWAGTDLPSRNRASSSKFPDKRSVSERIISSRLRSLFCLSFAWNRRLSLEGRNKKSLELGLGGLHHFVLLQRYLKIPAVASHHYGAVHRHSVLNIKGFRGAPQITYLLLPALQLLPQRDILRRSQHPRLVLFPHSELQSLDLLLLSQNIILLLAQLRNQSSHHVTWRRSLWTDWMAARESSGRDTGVRGNTLVFRLAKIVAGSLDDDGETFRVDPEALDLFLEEEAKAVTAWRLGSPFGWMAFPLVLGNFLNRERIFQSNDHQRLYGVSSRSWEFPEQGGLCCVDANGEIPKASDTLATKEGTRSLNPDSKKPSYLVDIKVRDPFNRARNSNVDVPATSSTPITERGLTGGSLPASAASGALSTTARLRPSISEVRSRERFEESMDSRGSTPTLFFYRTLSPIEEEPRAGSDLPLISKRFEVKDKEEETKDYLEDMKI